MGGRTYSPPRRPSSLSTKTVLCRSTVGPTDLKGQDVSGMNRRVNHLLNRAGMPCLPSSVIIADLRLHDKAASSAPCCPSMVDGTGRWTWAPGSLRG
jgi:hypothetical protein